VCETWLLLLGGCYANMKHPMTFRHIKIYFRPTCNRGSNTEYFRCHFCLTCLFYSPSLCVIRLRIVYGTSDVSVVTRSDSHVTGKRKYRNFFRVKKFFVLFCVHIASVSRFPSPKVNPLVHLLLSTCATPVDSGNSYVH
jgi:hypothetical protein